MYIDANTLLLLQVWDSKLMKSYRHGMKCMMRKGGRLVFHLSGESHCFAEGFQNFMICWSKFDFFVDSWIMFRGMGQMLQFSFLRFAEITIATSLGMSVSVALLPKVDNSIFTRSFNCLGYWTSCF